MKSALSAQSAIMVALNTSRSSLRLLDLTPRRSSGSAGSRYLPWTPWMVSAVFGVQATAMESIAASHTSAATARNAARCRGLIATSPSPGRCAAQSRTITYASMSQEGAARLGCSHPRLDPTAVIQYESPATQRVRTKRAAVPKGPEIKSVREYVVSPGKANVLVPEDTLETMASFRAVAVAAASASTPSLNAIEAFLEANRPLGIRRTRPIHAVGEPVGREIVMEFVCDRKGREDHREEHAGVRECRSEGDEACAEGIQKSKVPEGKQYHQGKHEERKYQEDELAVGRRKPVQAVHEKQGAHDGGNRRALQTSHASPASSRLRPLTLHNEHLRTSLSDEPPFQG